MGAMTDIVKTDGVGGLYQGWWSSVVSLGASNFTYFYAYNMLKIVFLKMLRKTQGDKAVISSVRNDAGR